MYTIKNVKSFRGMEGHGFNATLYRDKKRVCLVMDSAQGAEYNFEWADWKAEGVVIKGTNRLGTEYSYKVTPEEKKFEDFLETLPKVKNCITGKLQTASADGFIAQLVDEWESRKWLKRQCRNKTLIRLPHHKEGEYDSFKHKCDEGMRKHIAKEYPKAIIVNDTL